jgi:hypothetical protein
MPYGNFFGGYGRPAEVPNEILRMTHELVASDLEYARYVVDLGCLIPPTDDPLLPVDFQILGHMLFRIASRPSTVRLFVGIVRSDTTDATSVFIRWERDPRRQQGYSKKRWWDWRKLLEFDFDLPVEYRRAVQHFRAYARLMRIRLRSLRDEDYLIFPTGPALATDHGVLH